MPEGTKRSRSRRLAAGYEILGEIEGEDGSLTVRVLASGEEHEFSWGAASEPSAEKAHAWLDNWVAASTPAPPEEEAPEEGAPPPE